MEQLVTLPGLGAPVAGKFTKAMTGWFCDELVGLKWDHELFGKQVARSTIEEAAADLREKLDGIDNLNATFEFGGGGQQWGARRAKSREGGAVTYKYELNQRALAEIYAGAVEWFDEVAEAAEELALGAVYEEDDIGNLREAVFDGVVAYIGLNEFTDDADVLNTAWDVSQRVVEEVWSDVKGSGDQRG